MGKGSSAPPAPDYAAAANETAAGNLTNLTAQTASNRPTQNTPWGTSEWSNTGTPENPNWTQNITLSSQQQAALDSQSAIQQGQSALAQGLQGQVASTMSNGFNPASLSSYMSSIPGVQTNFSGFNPSGTGSVNLNAPQFSDATAKAGAQAAYAASTGLLKDQWSQDTKNQDATLRLQGLQPGTEAYNNAAQNLSRTQAQQQNQLADQAVQTGTNMANQNYASQLAGYNAGNTAQGQAYGQALAGYGANAQAQQNSNAAQAQQYTQQQQSYQLNYADALQRYLQPLNSMNAVLTGQQVQNPTMPSFASSGYTPGADMSGAASATGAYNSAAAANSAAGTSSTLGALGSLGGAAMMATSTF